MEFKWLQFKNLLINFFYNYTYHSLENIIKPDNIYLYIKCYLINIFEFINLNPFEWS